MESNESIGDTKKDHKNNLSMCAWVEVQSKVKKRGKESEEFEIRIGLIQGDNPF